MDERHVPRLPDSANTSVLRAHWNDTAHLIALNLENYYFLLD